MSFGNSQPTAQSITSPTVALHHIFATIQGEGPFAGTPAIFVRLFGCNLQCPFCDTDYTSKLEAVLPDDLARAVVKLQHYRHKYALSTKPLVVISGGEPFRQSILTELVNSLYYAGFQVQIETNGTLGLPDFPWGRAMVVCSPKTPRINPDTAGCVHVYKYVLDADHVDPLDGLPAGTMGLFERTARPPEGWEGQVFVQPLDEGPSRAEQNAKHLEAAVKSCLRFGYRLCIQTHKLANLE